MARAESPRFSAAHLQSSRGRTVACSCRCCASRPVRSRLHWCWASGFQRADPARNRTKRTTHPNAVAPWGFRRPPKASRPRCWHRADGRRAGRPCSEPPMSSVTSSASASPSSPCPFRDHGTPQGRACHAVRTPPHPCTGCGPAWASRTSRTRATLTICCPPTTPSPTAVSTAWTPPSRASGTRSRRSLNPWTQWRPQWTRCSAPRRSRRIRPSSTPPARRSAASPPPRKCLAGTLGERARRW
eukprot:scaffold145_cov261-Pinguiococcus_pyrenoidosus.AAC.5